MESSSGSGSSHHASGSSEKTKAPANYFLYGTPEKRPRLSGEIQELIKKHKATAATFFLNQISNAVLRKYLNQEDPLVFRQKELSELKQILKLADTESLTLGQGQPDIKTRIAKLEQEEETLKTLIGNRNMHQEKLIGAFPFAERKISISFIEKYIEKFPNRSNWSTEQIKEDLECILKITKDGNLTTDHSDYLSLLEIKTALNKSQSSYLAPTKNSLIKALEKVIGRSPQESEVEYYRSIHSKEQTHSIDDIKAEVEKYIADNSSCIRTTMLQMQQYVMHPDYLQYLRTGDFLSQVMSYRQISRDLQKTLLVNGEEGQLNAPPGLNTSIKITLGGAACVFVGELGSYKRIADVNIGTLQNYHIYTKAKLEGVEIETVEKEEAFEALHQVEVIRSSTALLTLPMFFELADCSYYSSIIGKKYDVKAIHEFFPMAMKGAVEGSVFLNNATQADFPYDYRYEGNKSKALELEKRNKVILIDYLRYKILDISNTKEKNTPESEPKVTFDGNGKVKKCFASVFFELINSWYGKSCDLSDIESLEWNFEPPLNIEETSLLGLS